MLVYISMANKKVIQVFKMNANNASKDQYLYSINQTSLGLISDFCPLNIQQGYKNKDYLFIGSSCFGDQDSQIYFYSMSQKTLLAGRRWLSLGSGSNFNFCDFSNEFLITPQDRSSIFGKVSTNDLDSYIHYDTMNVDLSQIEDFICSPENNIAVYLIRSNPSHKPQCSFKVLILKRGKQYEYDKRVYQIIYVEFHYKYAKIEIFDGELYILKWGHGQSQYNIEKIYLNGPTFSTIETNYSEKSSSFDVPFRVSISETTVSASFEVSFAFNNAKIFASLSKGSNQLVIDKSSVPMSIEDMMKIDGPLFGLQVYRNSKKAAPGQVDHTYGKVSEIKITNYDLIDQISVGGGATRFLNFISVDQFNRYMVGYFIDDSSLYVFGVKGLTQIMSVSIEMNCFMGDHFILESTQGNDNGSDNLVVYLGCEAQNTVYLKSLYIDINSSTWYNLKTYSHFGSIQNLAIFTTPGQNYIFLMLKGPKIGDFYNMKLVKAQHKVDLDSEIKFQTLNVFQQFYKCKFLKN